MKFVEAVSDYDKSSQNFNCILSLSFFLLNRWRIMSRVSSTKITTYCTVIYPKQCTCVGTLFSKFCFPKVGEVRLLHNVSHFGYRQQLLDANTIIVFSCFEKRDNSLYVCSTKLTILLVDLYRSALGTLGANDYRQGGQAASSFMWNMSHVSNMLFRWPWTSPASKTSDCRDSVQSVRQCTDEKPSVEEPELHPMCKGQYTGSCS